MTETKSRSTPDLNEAPNRMPSPADPVRGVDGTFSKIESAFMTLFGKVGLFGGMAPAMGEAVDCLSAATRIYQLERLGLWAERGEAFAIRLDSLEQADRPWLGLPSNEEEDVAGGDLLSRLEAHSLDPAELERVRALLGLRIATALSSNAPLPKGAIEAHESLLVCRRNRSRQHEDWRTVCAHADIGEGGLCALKLAVKSTVVKDFIDESLVALSATLVDPDTTVGRRAAGAAAARSADDVDGVDQDLTEMTYGELADIDIPAQRNEVDTGDGIGTQSPTVPSGVKHDKKISLMGWRIVDALYAPFVRKLGVTTSWGATPLPDHAAVCRSLKHDFLTKDVPVKHQVCVAYHSQQVSLPPQLVLTVPLKDCGGLYYDVQQGCYLLPYAQVLGMGTAAGETGEESDRHHGRMRIFIDPDLAEHHRESHARLARADTIGDLVESGTTPAEVERFLKLYRRFLRKHGDDVHPAYAGRHARSLGPAIKEITGSDVLSMFLALDGSMAAAGMLHYLTLTERYVHAQQQKVLTRLGWAPPPDLPDGDDDAVGAEKALPHERYLTGWQGLQADSAEAISALQAASSLHEIARAWEKLAQSRLLTFGCLTGHRLTRIARLTGYALFGSGQYICISDKVTSDYDAYRLVPVTARLEQFRACLAGDLDVLQGAIEQCAPDALKYAVVAGSPTKAVFFGLKTVNRSGKAGLKRTGLALGALDTLSQKHFGRNANIGRHQWVSGLVEAGVDHWLIRALTGHSNLNAEVFGDATATAPKLLLEQLRVAMDKVLADDGFEPHSVAPQCRRGIGFTQKVSTPPIKGDGYLHPTRIAGGRLLPPVADRHTLVSLVKTDSIRKSLLAPSDDRAAWIDLVLCLIAYDGLAHADVAEIWRDLSTSIVTLGATCAAAWTREGRSNLCVIPLSPPTLAALARVDTSVAPSWPSVTALTGEWLRLTGTNVRWPEHPGDAFLSFAAMASRWLRLHINPATHAASLRGVMSATLSAHSILRLAATERRQIPVDALANRRMLSPSTTRLRTGKLRDALRGVGRVLFRNGDTHKRLGEDEMRAVKALAQLPADSGFDNAVDVALNVERANEVLAALASHDTRADLPASAALAVVRKEANLILEHHKDARSWGGIATYWTEVALALELISPSEDLRKWCAADFEAWVEMAVAAIALDARKKGKNGAIEINGLRRFLKIGTMLGWEVPPGLLEGEDIYRQDGMRQSAVSTLLTREDFEAARPLVHHALSNWPLAQKRADLLLDFLIEVPARTGELDTAFARCVTTASRMLCIQPAGFSALKNELAVRLVALSLALAERLLDFDGEELDGLGEFLFLEEDGEEWTMLKSIRGTVYQALLVVTGDVNLRFHAARGNAACRIAFPQWEQWAKALIHGKTGATFAGSLPGTTRESVAQAISALGHGRTPTFLGYYYAVWPWVRAHELRMALGEMKVSVEYEKGLFDNTQARRAAKSRAERSGQVFDHWDWIGRQMSGRIQAPPLESSQQDPVITPQGEEESSAPALRALTRYGLWTLAGVPSATAGNTAGVDALCSEAMDAAIGKLAPSVEAVWERQGQPRGQRGADTDKALSQSEVGCSFCDHMASLPIPQLALLQIGLDVDRRRLLLMPEHESAQNELVRKLATSLPEGLAKLLVRQPGAGGFKVSPALVLELESQLAIGSDERDVGRHCLYQVVPTDEPDNRKRTGPITGLTRAACIAALAAHEVLNGVR